jgi:hypothetical protein
MFMLSELQPHGMLLSRSHNEIQKKVKKKWK